MKRCSNCGATIWTDTHICEPAWYCWVLSDGDDRDDASIVHASDAEAAAEKLVDERDPDRDYSCVSGNAVTVCVAADSTTDEIEVFVVTGEAVPQYSAEPVQVESGRTVLCVASRHHRGSQWWIELRTLEGEKLGGFTYPTQDTPPAPDFGDCVQVSGTLGEPGATIFWGYRYEHSWSIEKGAA